MDKGVLPRHVAIIMDGNGRWARQRGKERVFGHHEGAESVRACSELAVETGIEYLSFFAFSEENWNRPEAEVSELMRLMAVSILNEKQTFRKNNIRFVVIGNRSRLPEDLNRDIDEAMEETSDNTGLTLVVFLSYSGKWDIEQAALKFAATGAPAGRFGDYLATAGIPDPDLLIDILLRGLDSRQNFFRRDGGERRIFPHVTGQALERFLVLILFHPFDGMKKSVYGELRGCGI